jgi:hypothetical protein
VVAPTLTPAADQHQTITDLVLQIHRQTTVHQDLPTHLNHQTTIPAIAVLVLQVAVQGRQAVQVHQVVQVVDRFIADNFRL